MIYKKIRIFLCNFSWHRPIKKQILEGFQVYSICKFCNQKIMQDSQGNWF